MNTAVLHALTRAARLAKSPETVDDAEVLGGQDAIAVLDSQSTLAASSKAAERQAIQKVSATPPMEIVTKVLPDGRVIQNYKNVPETSAIDSVQNARSAPYLRFADQQLEKAGGILDARDADDAAVQSAFDQYETLLPGLDVDELKHEMGGFRSRAALARELGAGRIRSYVQSGKIALGLIPRDRALRQIASKRLMDTLALAKLRGEAHKASGSNPDDRRQLAGTSSEIAMRLANDDRAERKQILDEVTFVDEATQKKANALKSLFGLTDPARFESFDKFKAAVEGFRGVPFDADEVDLARAHFADAQARLAKEQLETKFKIEDQALQRRRLEQQEKAGSGSGNNDVAQEIADAIESGFQPPDLKGLYRFGALVRAELGHRGYDLSRAQLDWKAAERHIATLNGPQQTRLRQAVSAAYDQLDVVEGLYDEWKKVGSVSGIRVFNKISLAAAKNTPGRAGAAAQALHGQISLLVGELGNTLMGGNSPTDHALELAQSMLSGDWNEQTFKKALEQLRIDLRIRQNSLAHSQPVGGRTENSYTSRGDVQTSAGEAEDLIERMKKNRGKKP